MKIFGKLCQILIQSKFTSHQRPFSHLVAWIFVGCDQEAKEGFNSCCVNRIDGWSIADFHP